MRTTFGTIYKGILTLLFAAVLVLVPAGQATAATPAPGYNEVYEAQRIMNELGIPNGPHDGLNGPNTGQGLCVFRYISGMTPSRKNLDNTTLAKLRAYDKYATLADVPARTYNGQRTYLVALQTCQAMIYTWDKTYWAVLPISTGSADLPTPNGSYKLGGTVSGWTCSTEYPETCRDQTAGADIASGRYGNMYNKRGFKAGGFYIHGSNNVPTTPGSAGCIRVSVYHADWIADNIPTGTSLFVTGKYRESDRTAVKTSRLQSVK